MAIATKAGSDKTKIVITKTAHNTMDHGTIKFEVTLATMDTFGMKARAFIDFPSYYKPNIGDHVGCHLESKVKKHV